MHLEGLSRPGQFLWLCSVEHHHPWLGGKCGASSPEHNSQSYLHNPSKDVLISYPQSRIIFLFSHLIPRDSELLVFETSPFLSTCLWTYMFLEYPPSISWGLGWGAHPLRWGLMPDSALRYHPWCCLRNYMECWGSDPVRQAPYPLYCHSSLPFFGGMGLVFVLEPYLEVFKTHLYFHDPPTPSPFLFHMRFVPKCCWKSKNTLAWHTTKCLIKHGFWGWNAFKLQFCCHGVW